VTGRRCVSVFFRCAAGGIYTCYLLYGIFQETLYKPQADKTTFAATAFVLFVQCLFNAAVSFVVDVAVGAATGSSSAVVAKGAPAAETAGSFRYLSSLGSLDVALTSIVYILAMYTSNEALQYVTYPTQALAKSCKMIPVLIGRVVISRERYSLTKYACVLLMTLGIALFQFWGKKKMTTEGFGGEGMGMALLVLSLALDGMAGPFQEKLKVHQLTNNQHIVVNNVWASGLMLGVSLLLGQFWESVRRRRRGWAGRAVLWRTGECRACGRE
jgi:UDP-galactose transporter B1